ncbi:MAG: NUDIX domain-containing protein [Candidatus Cloacimonetes bacterium]|jgi:bifunctional NMN adenylyltransferase/nudix hydrolase|nr:NUDIX domain-containing protein [Candidatus Cloacimonadota bacterium]
MDVKRTDVGIIIGRFQVDDLHEAHIELIDTVVSKHSKVIMFLGLAPIMGGFKNPLDFEARKMMIQELYPSITVLYSRDVKEDRIWSKYLDKQIKDVVSPTQSVTLYGGRSAFINRYFGIHPCIELESKSYVSGSEIRKRISQAVKASALFRKGVIWASQNGYPSVQTTVDVAILDSNGEILLCRKPGEDLFQFVGGFAKPDTLPFEADGAREVNEETSVSVSSLKYVGSSFIDDWRYRDEVNKIKTIFYKAYYQFGSVCAKDDIAEAGWFKLDGFEKYVIPEHQPLVQLLKESFVKEAKEKETIREEILKEMQDKEKASLAKKTRKKTVKS